MTVVVSVSNPTSQQRRSDKDVITSPRTRNDNDTPTTTTATTTTSTRATIPMCRQNNDAVTSAATTATSTISTTTWMDHQLDQLRDTTLHPMIEMILAWIVAILCIIYYGYQYISSSSSSSSLLYRTFQQRAFMFGFGRTRKTQDPSHQSPFDTIQPQKRIPLMTEAVERRRSMDSSCRSEIISNVQRLYLQITTTLWDGNDNTMTVRTMTTMTNPSRIIDTIRHSTVLRRQVSQYTMLMTTLLQQQQPNIPSVIEHNPSSMSLEIHCLYELFDSIWIDLLRLPPSSSSFSTPSSSSSSTTILETTVSTNDRPISSQHMNGTDVVPTVHPSASITNETEKITRTYAYTISLIIPAYQESGHTIQTTLQVALRQCATPKSVQVILVNAGQCYDMHYIEQLQQQQQQTQTQSQSQSTSAQRQHSWGMIQQVHYTNKDVDHDGGGRGSCQNYGAQFATGRYITFLHSDTLLPYHWDVKVQRTLDRTSTNWWNGATIITHACAFCVGHNVSQQGLGTTMSYPYGIRSILLLGNLRAWLFRLPYGDHILSFHTSHFRYIGGFPNQSIMEDYCIMDLLRQRATVLPETLRIIPPPTGLCSVRRWQKYGVVYVTLTNALLVHRFAYGGWTADDVFSYYYLRSTNGKKES
jgi:glycosyltransferase involved in cell wall biosynthesis